MTTAAPPTPDVLMRAYDQSRERTHQREIGMSAVGGCRRAAGYLLSGTEPSNEGGNIQAVIGTGMHTILAEQVMKTAEPGDLVEYEVRFAGLLGHVDYYHAKSRTVIDWKSTSKWKFESVQADGISLDNRYQTALYAAALAMAGFPVVKIILDYVCRDTGECYRHERPFVHSEVKAALDWIANIRDSDVDMLPRDYAPQGPFCQGCPFFKTCWEDRAVPGRDLYTALWTDDPDAAKWRDELAEARKLQAAAKERAERAKGALDALRPDDGGRLQIEGGKGLSWSKSSKLVLDKERVLAEFAAAGMSPPMRRTESVTLNLVKPEEPKEKSS